MIVKPLNPSEACIAFVGDCRSPNEAVLQDPWLELKPWLRQANLVVVNLEGPIGRTGEPRSDRGALLSNSEQALADWRFVQNRLYVLANNHIMDFGAQALVQTIAKIREDGSHFVGAGRDEDEARRAVILQVGKKRIGFLAYTTQERHVGSICAAASKPGCADLYSPRTLHDVHTLSQEVDVACVLLHWGHEFHSYPSPAQLKWIEKLESVGGRVLVGHHPHVIQGMRVTPRSVVAYSLGNAYFPPFRQTNGRLWIQLRDEREFLLLKVKVDEENNIAAESVAGLRDRRQRLQPYRNAAHASHLKRMQSLSEPLKRGDYSSFYSVYAERRSRELRRAAILKSIIKVRWQDLRSVRTTDFSRLWKRLWSQ